MLSGLGRKTMKHSLLCLIIFLCCACTGSDKKPLDTPTTGSIHITVDETFGPVTDSQVYTFNSLYKYADVRATHAPENDCFRDLLNDTSRLVIAARDLNKEERVFFEAKKLFPRTVLIAYDAIALIIHPD